MFLVTQLNATLSPAGRAIYNSLGSDQQGSYFQSLFNLLVFPLDALCDFLHAGQHALFKRFQANQLFTPTLLFPEQLQPAAVNILQNFVTSYAISSVELFALLNLNNVMEKPYTASGYFPMVESMTNSAPYNTGFTLLWDPARPDTSSPLVDVAVLKALQLASSTVLLDQYAIKGNYIPITAQLADRSWVRGTFQFVTGNSSLQTLRWTPMSTGIVLGGRQAYAWADLQCETNFSSSYTTLDNRNIFTAPNFRNLTVFCSTLHTILYGGAGDQYADLFRLLASASIIVDPANYFSPPTVPFSSLFTTGWVDLNQTIQSSRIEWEQGYIPACAPIKCTYQYSQGPDLADLATTLLGLLGGIVSGLKFALPLIFAAFPRSYLVRFDNWLSWRALPWEAGLTRQIVTDDQGRISY